MNFILLYYIFLFRKRNQILIIFLKKGFYFLVFFVGQKGICPGSYVSPGAMRKSDLRSSL